MNLLKYFNHPLTELHRKRENSPETYVSGSAQIIRSLLMAVILLIPIGVSLWPSWTKPADALVAVYEPDQVVKFVGSGSGHGVGMSQWGARGRALEGQTAQQIVGAYYQGSQLMPHDTAGTRIRVLIDEEYLPPAIDGSFTSSNKLPGNVYGWGGPWAIEGVTGPLQPGTRLNLVSKKDQKSHHAYLYNPAGQLMIQFGFPGALKLVSLSPETRIQVYYKYTRIVPGSGGTQFYDMYRGDIWIRQNAEGTLDTVNELGIDDYVRGVVPAEMPRGWPMEALKAQSLAARTYALTSLKPSNHWWDLDDTTYYQLYEGSHREHHITNSAVEQTWNTIIGWNGQPIRSYYFSSGGGFTESAGDVFSQDLPYLKGFRDHNSAGLAFDRDAPAVNWQTSEFPMKVIEDMLNEKDNSRIGSLRRIDFSDRSASGRVKSVFIEGSEINRRLDASFFQAIYNKRTPVALGEMLSTKFDVEFAFPHTRPVPRVNIPGQSIYFEETGHNIFFGFKKYFERKGGVATFGLPLTEEFDENGIRVQYFQKVRLEYHPELAGTPYEVQLGLVGDQIAAGRNYAKDTPFANNSQHRYFPETQNSIHFGFKKYFERFGGVDRWGYPISQEVVEGGTSVQYFQRGRLEWRPEMGGMFGVFSGNVGEEYLRLRGWLS